MLPATFLVLALGASSPGLAEGFLRDGGGIRTQRIVPTPYGPSVRDVPSVGRDRPFLQDGGSIRYAPELPRVPNRRPVTGRSLYQPDPARPYRDGRRSSIIVIQNNAAMNSDPSLSTRSGNAHPGAKIIDVASARLDRQPFDASGRSVTYFGSTKIMRIAPPADRAETRSLPAMADARDGDRFPELEGGDRFSNLPARDRATVVYSDPDLPKARTAAPERATPAAAPPSEPPKVAAVPEARPEPAAAPFLEPWTEEWLRDCVARHPDFDASLGTYPDENGRRRFCTGER